MEVAFKTTKDLFIQTLLFSFLSVFVAGHHGLESDVNCLKSIKESLDDQNRLSSWDFSNKAEVFICDFVGVTCWHPDDNRVLNLDLRDMGLKGVFPRGIQNCKSLSGLDLAFNNLSGPIPSDISSILPYATMVDLSHNQFSGEIPSAFANCTYLNALKLDDNMLSGQIPQQLGQLTRIKEFTVSSNNLSGSVPVFYHAHFSAESYAYAYANNKRLCGAPLPPCPTEFHQSFKDGLIVGYVFSVTSVIVAYMTYCAPWTQLKQTRNNHRNNKAKKLTKFFCSIIRRKTPIEADQVQELLPLLLEEKGTKEISVVVERLASTMRFEELCDATGCFTMDNAIGVGKMGIMYEGRLPNGWYLAVKRLFHSHLFKKQFLLEILIPGKYRHRNIVPLLGFCTERKERILVYQYMSNGRLSKWLHPLENEVPLKWPQRVKIALGIARGLSWLHHSCHLRVVHLNLCSECILLDKNFEPKISNFGGAKFMNLDIDDDLGMGMGYVNDGKKDVYDFGSMLFELITGKTFKELSCSSTTSDLCGNPSNFYDEIDKSLIGKGFENEVFTLIKVACQCVQPVPDQRPTMLVVYNYMKMIWEGRHRSTDDSNTSTQSEIVSCTGIDEIVNF